MKKILAMMLSVVLCVSMPFSVCAAEDDVTGTTSEPGAYLYVDATGEELSVELVAETAITDGVATITYDTDAVTYAGYFVSDKVTMYSINAEEAGTIRVSWISESAVTGTLFTFDFSRTQGVEITDETYTLTGTATDADGKTVSIGVDTDTVDKFVLQSLYDASLTLTEEAYTEESWAALEKAGQAALTVLNDANATQDEVDAALADLVDAFDGLTLVTAEVVDKSVLQKLYNSGLLLTEEDYTSESWSVFSEAMTAALAVLEDENATAEEVETARNTLLEAYLGLDKVDSADEEVDKEVLMLLYETSLKLSGSSYSEESWAVLETAEAAAFAVLNDENATQEEIEAALVSLVEALEALTQTATDKEALQAAYDAVLALDSTGYTEESWAVLTEASDAALAVLNNADATQEEIDAALANLLAAMEDLVAKAAEAEPSNNGSEEENNSEDETGSETETGSESGSEFENTEDSNATDSNSSGSNHKTGDLSVKVFGALMLIGACGAVFVLVSRKRSGQR